MPAFRPDAGEISLALSAVGVRTVYHSLSYGSTQLQTRINVAAEVDACPHA